MLKYCTIHYTHQIMSIFTCLRHIFTFDTCFCSHSNPVSCLGVVQDSGLTGLYADPHESCQMFMWWAVLPLTPSFGGGSTAHTTSPLLVDTSMLARTCFCLSVESWSVMFVLLLSLILCQNFEEYRPTLTSTILEAHKTLVSGLSHLR